MYNRRCICPGTYSPCRRGSRYKKLKKGCARLKSNGTVKYLSSVTALLVVGVAGVLVQTVLLNLYYVFDDMLWAHGTPSGVGAAFYIIAAVSAAVAVAVALMLKRHLAGKNVPGASFDAAFSRTDESFPGAELPERAAAAACAAAMVFAFAAQFFSPAYDHLRLILDSSYVNYYSQAAFAHTACLVLILPAVLYFAFCAAGKRAPVATCIILVFFVIAFTLRVYYDMSVILSNPRRLSSIFSLIMFLLFITAKSGTADDSRKPVLVALSGSIAFVCCLQDSLPNLVLNLSGSFSDGIQVFYYLTMFTFSLYALACVRTCIFRTLFPLPAEVSTDYDQNVREDTQSEAAGSEGAVCQENSGENSDGEHGDPLADCGLTRDQIERFYTILCEKTAESARENSEEPDPDKIGKGAALFIKTLLESGEREENVRRILSVIEKESRKEKTEKSEGTPAAECDACVKPQDGGECSGSGDANDGGECSGSGDANDGNECSGSGDTSI